MRSIRLSLIVYFLVLLALAMSGVSWFSYQTTAQALRGKRDSTMELLQSQYTDQEQQIVTNLDNHIARKAQFLAGAARVSKDYLEPLFAIGVLGTPLATAGLSQCPVVDRVRAAADLSFDLFSKRPSDIVIKDAEDVLAARRRHTPASAGILSNLYRARQNRSSNRRPSASARCRSTSNSAAWPHFGPSISIPSSRIPVGNCGW